MRVLNITCPANRKFQSNPKKSVRVLDIRAKIAGTKDKCTYLRRLERVVTGEVDVQEEDASMVWWIWATDNFKSKRNEMVHEQEREKKAETRRTHQWDPWWWTPIRKDCRPWGRRSNWAGDLTWCPPTPSGSSWRRRWATSWRSWALSSPGNDDPLLRLLAGMAAAPAPARAACCCTRECEEKGKRWRRAQEMQMQRREETAVALEGGAGSVARAAGRTSMAWPGLPVPSKGICSLPRP